MTTQEADFWLEQLLAEPGEAARQSFVIRPELEPYLVQLAQLLVARVDTAIRREPQASLGLAELAVLAADKSGTMAEQGLSYRAKAHALRAVGRYQEALPFYRQAITFLKKAGLSQEESRTYLGELAALSSLGNYAECLKQGRTIRRRLTKLEDSLNLARLDSNLAIVNHLLGRYQAALRLHNRSIRLFETLGQMDLIPVTRLNRANTFWQLNRFRQAASDYEACREVFEQKGQAAFVAIVDTNLGFLLFSQGRYNEALEALTSARDRFETTGQPERRALAEIDLAHCYSVLGLYKESLVLYEQAISTLSEIGAKYEALRAELGRAQVLLYTGQLAQAEQSLDRIRQIYDTAGESERNRHALAVTWFYRAHLLGRTQRELEALELCLQAQAVFTELKLVEWHAQTILLEASLQQQLGHWDEADKIYQQAEIQLTPLNLPHLFYQLDYGRGKLAQSRPSSTNSPVERLRQNELARHYYRKAIQQVETIRAILRPEELRLAFMENGLGAYEALVTLCLEANDQASLEEAFTCVERSKSRSLLDLLSQNVARSARGLPENQSRLTEKIEALRQELNWFYSQLHSPSRLGSQEEGQRPLQLEAEKVSQQLPGRERELARLLRQYRPQLFESERNRAETTWSAELLQGLRQVLESDQSLVEYYISGEQIIAFVLTKNGLSAFQPLCKLTQVRDLQERLNFQTNKFSLGSAYIKRNGPAMLQAVDFYLAQLYKLLVAPLLAKLVGSKLVIVPHANLHSLPFHAFFDGQHYLTNHFEISYAPSAAVFLHCVQQERFTFQKLLAVGVSDPNLEGIETEARQLTEFFPQTRLLTGSAATRQGLEENLEWCEVLHLASHGVFREDNPLFSLLKLADGWLSAYDIMEWQHCPALVTLSACQTGLNQPLRGDELLGLVRSLFSAGASSLVASLWPVSDAATACLMRYFYQNLAGGHGLAAALRLAMLKLMTDPEYRHPYYWASFLVMGQP